MGEKKDTSGKRVRPKTALRGKRFLYAKCRKRSPRPQLPPNLELGAVSAVATDAKDRVFVAHRAAKPILVFDREGKFVRGWGDDHIKTPHGLRIDPDGNVWVTDIGNHLVMKFDPDGKLLLSLGRKGEAGSQAISSTGPPMSRSRRTASSISRTATETPA